ncbi:hypothetical protein D3C85_1882050 [compost metagenome]
MLIKLRHLDDYIDTSLCARGEERLKCAAKATSRTRASHVMYCYAGMRFNEICPMRKRAV